MPDYEAMSGATMSMTMGLVTMIAFMSEVMGRLRYKKVSNLAVSAASDPAWSEGGGGPRNMNIFFMTSFNKDRGGGMAPLAPPWIRSWSGPMTVGLVLAYSSPFVAQLITSTPNYEKSVIPTFLTHFSSKPNGACALVSFRLVHTPRSFRTLVISAKI